MTNELETLTHRLILPREANHHGTLYAGSLVALALEAAYSTGYRAIGTSANLVLKRVVDLRCLEPVPIGEVVQIRGVVLFQRSAQIVVGLYGSPLRGRPKPFERYESIASEIEFQTPWDELANRLTSLLAIRRPHS